MTFIAHLFLLMDLDYSFLTQSIPNDMPSSESSCTLSSCAEQGMLADYAFLTMTNYTLPNFTLQDPPHLLDDLVIQLYGSQLMGSQY